MAVQSYQEFRWEARVPVPDHESLRGGFPPQPGCYDLDPVVLARHVDAEQVTGSIEVNRLIAIKTTSLQIFDQGSQFSAAHRANNRNVVVALGLVFFHECSQAARKLVSDCGVQDDHGVEKALEALGTLIDKLKVCHRSSFICSGPWKEAMNAKTSQRSEVDLSLLS
jgi:hypothetical protein